ncbi:hypothetical protein INT43_008094 [Umbelopsis isabellina]|uniref:Carboxylesterase type B domain-containing protein n=1 Tax=Mortierella isabellina TaxID=91625 RepID=A0A8H7U9Q8_MORIS|nr:hypothetical protein INT43_008094 [Umbelopsis isabellina]
MATTIVDIPKLGKVKGKVFEKSNIRRFHIPYATVPKRWRVAKPVPAWEGELDCTQQRPECPQSAVPGDRFLQPQRVPPTYDEFNCLNVDITAPPNLDNSSLVPCMIWIHGGAFMAKTGLFDAYDPEKFVEHSIQIGKPVVVVNVTYRLNLFGFFSSSDIKSDVEQDGETVYGNWGLDDAVKAFHWVKENIKSFGGDPNRITGYGESAGSIMLHHLLLRPDITFTRAILQSGVVSVVKPVPPSSFDPVWRKLLDHYQAETVDDMRKVPAEDIIKLGFEYFIRHQPLIDGAICEDPVREYKEPGAYASLEAVIIGDCAEEGTLWSRRGDIKEIYKSYEDPVPSSLLDRFHLLYPSDVFDKDAAQAQKMVDELVGEAKFICPIDRTAKAIAKLRPEAPLYRYRVNRTIEITQDLGVHHGIDIFFIFMNDKLTKEERVTSEKMCSDWLYFAYGEKLEETSGWNRYQLDDPSVMIYGEQATVTDMETSRSSARCKFWEDVENASLQRS